MQQGKKQRGQRPSGPAGKKRGGEGRKRGRGDEPLNWMHAGKI